MKKNISIDLIDNNEGQIPGLPTNPRIIKDKKYEQLVDSILTDPEMLGMRECLVIPFNQRFVAVGGNMRLRATVEVIRMPQSRIDALIKQKENEDGFLAWLTAIHELRDKREIPCHVIDKDMPLEKVKRIAIKDNMGYGEWNWEEINNEWDVEWLNDFGFHVPGTREPKEKEPEVSADYNQEHAVVVICMNEIDQDNVLNTLKDKGYSCRKLNL